MSRAEQQQWKNDSSNSTVKVCAPLEFASNVMENWYCTVESGDGDADGDSQVASINVAIVSIAPRHHRTKSINICKTEHTNSSTWAHRQTCNFLSTYSFFLLLFSLRLNWYFSMFAMGLGTRRYALCCIWNSIWPMGKIWDSGSYTRKHNTRNGISCSIIKRISSHQRHGEWVGVWVNASTTWWM